MNHTSTKGLMLESTCLALASGRNSRSAACEHDDYGTGPRTPADPTAPVAESDGRAMLRMHTATASPGRACAGECSSSPWFWTRGHYEAPEKKKRVLIN